MECHYKEHDRLLTEQFISQLNSDGMSDEILKEVATLEDIEGTISECILLWSHKADTQRTQNLPLII